VDRITNETVTIQKTKYLGLSNKLHPKSYDKPRFKTDDFEVAESCAVEWGPVKDEVSKSKRKVVIL
jgi:hypothetical protein